ncbi:MAG: GTP-binding protein [Thermoleophilaceae bacterium]
MVDVPGHERFVRTMVAGASGIDVFLLCVAADDGVMPQTREHLAVLRQLGVTRGVVAVTKADVGEPELAAEEAAELLPGVEAVPVSALRRTGLDELLAALERAATGVAGRAALEGRPARLHVDRSFTLRGIGTVVTGTLWQGSIAVGDQVTVLPRGLETRVRSVQAHDRVLERASAGQRVALNLAGISWREMGRGDLLVPRGDELRPTYHVDATVAIEPGARPVRRGERVHVHHGTREAPARVYPLEGDDLRAGETGLAQLRLEAPLVPERGDRVILRQLAPPDTIGGGEVLDATARKHGAGRVEVVARLRAIERGRSRWRPRAPPRASLRLGPTMASQRNRPSTTRTCGWRRCSAPTVASPEPTPTWPRRPGLSAADAGERLKRLTRAGQAVRVARNQHFHPEPLAELEAQVVAICQRDGEATLAGVRDELGTTRKYAQALARAPRRDQGDGAAGRRARASASTLEAATREWTGPSAIYGLRLAVTELSATALRARCRRAAARPSRFGPASELPAPGGRGRRRGGRRRRGRRPACRARPRGAGLRA